MVVFIVYFVLNLLLEQLLVTVNQMI